MYATVETFSVCICVCYRSTCSGLQVIPINTLASFPSQRRGLVLTDCACTKCLHYLVFTYICTEDYTNQGYQVSLKWTIAVIFACRIPLECCCFVFRRSSKTFSNLQSDRGSCQVDLSRWSIGRHSSSSCSLYLHVSFIRYNRNDIQ